MHSEFVIRPRSTFILKLSETEVSCHWKTFVQRQQQLSFNETLFTFEFRERELDIADEKMVKTCVQYLFRFHSRPNYFQPRISIERRIERKSGRLAICRKLRKSCSPARDNI